MPVNNIASGMSSAPLPYGNQNQGYQYSSLGGFLNLTGTGADPTSIINNAISSRQLQNYAFPSDLPKYNFTIIETDFTRMTLDEATAAFSQIGSQNNPFANLNPQKRYKLPLPSPLTDSFEVQYEQDFSYLGAMASTLGSIVSGRDRASGAGRFIQGMTNAVEQTARAAGAFAGLTLNQFKTVTMSSPKYRTFQFNWKFAPKNFVEAREIQRIMYSLRRGMSPSVSGSTSNFWDRTILHFPKIYIMYFSPNAKFLYKFKPCVLTSMSIDYNGGNPSPAFYKFTGSVENSPPEAVTMSTSWLELEYWLDARPGGTGDYKMDQGLPTNDPFDGWNTYTLDPGTASSSPGNQSTPTPNTRTREGNTPISRQRATIRGGLGDDVPNTPFGVEVNRTGN